ncbi:MAG: hypothetical protein AAGA99_00635 [Actinomycetota bacterium]
MEEFRERLLAEGWTEDEVEQYIREVGFTPGSGTEGELDARLNEARRFLADVRAEQDQPVPETLVDTQFGQLDTEVDDVDGDGDVDEDDTAAADREQARETLVNQLGGDEELADVLLAQTNTGTQWMMSAYGAVPSHQEMQRIVAFRLGIADPSLVTDDLIRQELGERTPENEMLMSSMSLGQQPTLRYTYGPVDDRQESVISMATVEQISRTLPGAAPFLPSLVMANAGVGGSEDSLIALASVGQVRGLYDPVDGLTVGDLESRANSIALAQRDEETGTVVMDGTIPGLGQQTPSGVDPGHLTEEGLQGVARAGNAILAGIRSMQFAQARQDMDTAYERYGDWTMAIIAAGGRDDLADKLWNDPWSLTAEERSSLGQILTSARWDPQNAADAGLFIDPEKYSFIMDLAQGGTGSGGSGGREIPVPDSAALEENFRSLFTGLMLRDPSDAELGAYSGAIQAMTAARYRSESSSRNPLREDPAPSIDRIVEGVDPTGQALQRIRGSAEFQQLYQHRRDGESEEQFQQRIGAPSTRLFAGGGGADVAVEDLREGLISGDAQTTVARTFFRDQSGNSAFQERLARLGEAMEQVI